MDENRTPDQSSAGYESPRLVVLGSLTELTRGTPGLVTDNLLTGSLSLTIVIA
jgi:hypothetical protein